MEKPKKNKPYMMYLKQSLAAVKPQYHAYRDGKNVVYTIEGDMTRHRFSVRQGEHEVLVLHKKIAKLFAEYTIEKEGQEIAHIKKGLFRYEMMIFDSALEEVAVALAVICDHVSDKADSTRYSD